MVVLRIKRPEGLEFSFRTTVNATVEETLRQLVELHNLLLLCKRLAAELEAGALGQGGEQCDPQAIVALRGLLHGGDSGANLTCKPTLLAGFDQCGDDGLTLPETTLWFGSKALQPGKKLSEYLGRNEKTRATIKIQQTKAGAPPREPPVDAETQQAMMAWYYKRQEEQRLASLNDPADSDPAWASDNALKQHFTGVSNIRIR
ncbi:hypothetical protein N2152v2_002434 [Parachlorella kessleri]